MKKLLALLFVAVLALAGCVQKKSDVEGGGNADTSTGEKPTIEILGTAAGENDLNILRDQLTKNGFEVVLNIQPDYGSFSAQKMQVTTMLLYQAGRQ